MVGSCLRRTALLLGSLAISSSYAQNSTTTPTTSVTPSIITTVVGTRTITYRPEFTVPAAADEGAPLIPNIRDPQALDAQSVCPGYTASNVVSNDLGLTARLTLAGPACNVYGNDVQTLDLTVQYQNADRLSVYIRPSILGASNSSYYILSESIVPRPAPDADAIDSQQDNDFQFVWVNNPTFQFSVIRKSTGDVAFSTMGSKIVYEDQFIEFVTDMPQNYNTYGLGERIHGLRLGNNFTATIYNTDQGDAVDFNLYGTHPFYLDTRYYEIDENSGNSTLFTGNASEGNATYQSYSHGVFLRNAHGQEILMRENNITWRTLGGAIDLYFFDGPSAPEVTKQYQMGATGYPAMQQYFTFGYHQCRWGYQNWTVLQEVVDTFRRFDIPLENIWTDIDYMQQYRDFTTDPNTFPVAEGQQFLSRLHANGQHYIPIIDAAIYIPNPDNATDAYGTYTRGHEMQAFLKNPDGSEYIGAVWPGYTVFPDLQSPNGIAWWASEVVRWYQEIQFDGIWIDMNEASSFCLGSCGSANLSLNPVHPSFALPGEQGNQIFDYPEGFNSTNSTEAARAASLSSSQSSALAASSAATETAPSTASSATPTSSYYRTTPTPGVRNVELPPYVINNIQGQLGVHAVAPNATHANGVQEYDVHNIWGYQLLNATYNGLSQTFPGKRPFIIGRSTFPGSGKYAGHWGGDNYSKWAYMYFGIPQMLSFSLFGINMFGVDTCGFNGNTDYELCSRWMQLSAFTPFYRNHNTLTADPQEPYVWSSVADATRTAMRIRFLLLPYMYTLFHASHTTGSTVMRALAWEFPNDPSLANADRQFLLGPSVLVTPVLEQGATSVNGVFPGSRDGTKWYDWYTQSAVTYQPGANVSIPAPLGHIPVYIRGGSILPTQEPGYTTRESRQKPWGVIVALNSEGSASGSLYLDDGESISPNATREVDFVFAQNVLYASVKGNYSSSVPLANVTVLGLGSQPRNITFNGMSVGSGASSFNSTSGALTLTGLGNMTSTGAWTRDWNLRFA